MSSCGFAQNAVQAVTKDQTRLDGACNLIVDKCDVIQKLLQDLEARIAPISVNLPRVNSATPMEQVKQDIKCDLLSRFDNFAGRLQEIINHTDNIIENVNI